MTLRDLMPTAHLAQRLSSIAPGEIETLDDREFELTFPLPDLDEAKRAAEQFAGAHGCEVIFIHERGFTAIFKRRDLAA
jgi:hypothetical protein